MDAFTDFFTGSRTILDEYDDAHPDEYTGFHCDTNGYLAC